jgi:hydroxycarboxylate dehydrogenase B
MAPQQVVVGHEVMRDFVTDIFAKAGSNPREAQLIAEQLVEANLAGHDSHGVGSIPVYIRNARSGDLPLNQALSVALESGPLLVCDGHGGAGQVMGHEAIARAIAVAQEHGACILGLRNSHHLGRIGHWAAQCAAAGLVSIHFVNVISAPAVAPFGGTAARLGTNPFAVGIPRSGERPIIIDFATSKLAVGKVRVALNQGKSLPGGVLLTPDGQPTTDPAKLFGNPRGVLLPFGEHKGWGLGLACELLGAALTGGATQAGPKSRDAVINSMLSILVSPHRLGTEDSYFAEIARFTAWAQSGENRDVLLPGDVEAATRTQRMASGIPIDAKSWSDIVRSAAEVGAEPPTGVGSAV